MSVLNSNLVAMRGQLHALLEVSQNHVEADGARSERRICVPGGAPYSVRNVRTDVSERAAFL